MANVKFQNLDKVYIDPQTHQQVHAVKGLNLDIRDGEFMVVVGPSGCGKSTALRMLAGLEEISSGEIVIGERVVNEVPSRSRDIAMVFQNYALYPHMSVYDNMAYGLRIKLLPPGLSRWTKREETKRASQEIDRRIQEAAELLDIKHLLTRKPRALSGGQRQRVALGRAIVREPQAFLMDEPLSNLDAKLRVQTRAELVKLHRRLGVTTIYVTHDQVEAMTMGQRIAVLKDGVLQQCDTPLRLYHEPVNLFVAGFLGTPAMNFLPAHVRREGEKYFLETETFNVPLSRRSPQVLALYVDKTVTCGIRPEHIKRTGAKENGVVRAHVDVIEAMGAISTVFLSVGRNTLIATFDADDAIQVNAPLDIAIDSAGLHLFDDETQCRIVA